MITVTNLEGRGNLSLQSDLVIYAGDVEFRYIAKCEKWGDFLQIHLWCFSECFMHFV